MEIIPHKKDGDNQKGGKNDGGKKEGGEQGRNQL